MRQDDSEVIRQNFLGQEDGHIYFFYRPKVMNAQGIEDVDTMYVVMHPFDKKHFRLIALDGSQFPLEGDPFSYIVGTVLKVSEKQKIILHELDQRTEMFMGTPKVYQAAARPCGEGVYTLIMQGKQMHLVYILELPNTDGKITEALRIRKRGNFTLGVYNPYYGTPPAPEPTSSRSPVLPESLSSKFTSERVVYDDVKELIDYENIKVSLNRESTEAIRGIARELHPLPTSEKTADIFLDLQLKREKNPVEPLIIGEWR
jgi:hypothetical protein